MAEQNIKNNLTQELRRGSLVMIVLINLKTEEYGYSLVNKIQDAGIMIEQNTLYPLLRRLEKQELLMSSWDTSESRPRKYYKISENGLTILDSMITEWKRINTQIDNML